MAGDRARRWVHASVRVLTALFTLAVLVVAGVAIWLVVGVPADGDAYAAVAADSDLEIDDHGGVLELRPAANSPTVGVVFYPGARIDHTAYAATWAPVVEATGVAVFVPRMPFNLAPFAADRIESIRAANPAIDTWLLGGHSMGGFAALDFVTDHPGAELAGLVLWASAGPPRTDPSAIDVPTLTVAGELDDVIPLDAIERSEERFAAVGELVVVPGMTHSQFGRYRADAVVDGRSDEDTQADLTRAVIDFLEDVAPV